MARPVGEAREALLAKALPPLGHVLRRHVEAGGNVVVAPSRRREEDDPGTYDVSIRCGIFTRERLKDATLL
jgi:hypothetical protein